MNQSGGKPPPPNTRFAKGQSGNPKGRPRKTPTPALQSSAFDIILDRSLPVVQGGVARDMSIEDALQLKTYQQALAGSRMARRTILKMIAQREAARAKLAAKSGGPAQTYEFFTLTDPDNANAALLILGIARTNMSMRPDDDPRTPLLLEPWAVQAALSRRRLAEPIASKDIAEINSCTLDAASLRWPRGSRA